MEFVTESGKTRKNLIIESAIELQKKILNTVNDAKIGIVKFDGPSGRLDFAGTSDAKKVLDLTNKEEDIENALKNINNTVAKNGTNTSAGILRANSSFSKNAGNKIIVLFTDGLPNADVGDGSIALGNIGGFDNTMEEMYDNTKYIIEKAKNSGTYIISMMTGLNREDEDYASQLEALTRVFGTEEKPTAGEFYNIEDSNINNIVSDNIFDNVIQKIKPSINNIKIEDYFTNEIIENFDFSYVEKPSKGTVSQEIIKEKKAIEWNIDTLKYEETATLKYRLKIKDMKNKELLDKVISTNQKLVITCKDINNVDYKEEDVKTPKIKLIEIKEQANPEDKPNDPNMDKEDPKDDHNKQPTTPGKPNGQDDTTAKKDIPQTGVSYGVVVAIIALLAIGSFTLIKLRKSRDI